VVFTNPSRCSGYRGRAIHGATRLGRSSQNGAYSRAYDKSEWGGFIILLSDGDRITGAYALGPEAGEWLQQATLGNSRARAITGLADVIQPFPPFRKPTRCSDKTHGQVRHVPNWPVLESYHALLRRMSGRVG